MERRSRSMRLGWAEAVWLASVVLVLGAAAITLRGQAQRTTAPTGDQPSPDSTEVAIYPPPLDLPMEPFITDIPTPTPIPVDAPYPPPTRVIPAMPEPSPYNPRPEDPYMMGVCAEVQPPELVGAWTRDAAIIVRGTVAEVLPPRWTTPDGSRPTNPHTDNETIYRPVVIEVERYLKGEQPTQQLAVMARGGEIGMDSVDYCGRQEMYTFYEGDEVILFLYDEFHTSHVYNDMPLWEIVEHYSVKSYNHVTARGWSAPLPQVLDEIETALQQ